jgi:hypothetical protein
MLATIPLPERPTVSSPHKIATAHLEAALEEAANAGIDVDRVYKAMTSQLLTRWAGVSGAADVRGAVEFELEHMGGDTDIPFMRP